ncbi:hybrid signal transduction histidine kinase M [Tanacetum coccineum]
MTVIDPPPQPLILLSDKLMTITNLNNLIPVTLDIEEMNYSSWLYFVQNLCQGHSLLDHILGKDEDDASSSNKTPADAEWLKIDTIILSWIFRLRSLKLEDLTMDAYFRKIESIATVLTSLGSHVYSDDVVTFALEGLPAKYDKVSTIIAHREPFPDLKTVRSMLTTEDMRLKSREQETLIDATSSSPMVLLAKSGSNVRRSSSPVEKVNKPCFNFNKGSCRYGSSCKFLHNGMHGLTSRKSSMHDITSSTLSPNDMQTLQHLLSKLGCHGNTSNVPTVGQTNMATNVTSPSPIALQTSHQVPSPGYVFTHGPPGFFGPPGYTAQQAVYNLPQVQ